jgi:ABC-type dipeptide/oligopeptide/nickel transport system permease subunit
LLFAVVKSFATASKEEKMLIEEKNAKDYWCPMTRVVNSRGSTVNRNESGKHWFGTQCLGNKCMFWRIMDSDLKSEGDYGYCGIAGKPE